MVICFSFSGGKLYHWTTRNGGIVEYLLDIAWKRVLYINLKKEYLCFVFFFNALPNSFPNLQCNPRKGNWYLTTVRIEPTSSGNSRNPLRHSAITAVYYHYDTRFHLEHI